MIRLLLLFYLLCIGKGSFSQSNNVLNGYVLYQSSDRQPVGGIAISGYSLKSGQATQTHSNPQGVFQLIFPTAQAGNLVNLSIGNKLPNGQMIELVNKELVSNCRIPDRSDQQFYIIVCRKGERDLAAQKYYGIIKTSVILALQEKEEQVQKLQQNYHQNRVQIESLNKVIRALKEQVDSVAIYREALFLASINTDDASEQLLTYLQLIESGKTIQEAREALDLPTIEQQFDKSSLQAVSARKALEIRARASMTIFDLKDAIHCYQKLILFFETPDNYISPFILAHYHQKLSIALRINGQYKQALDYGFQSLTIRQKYRIEDSVLASTYNNIGLIYQKLGQYDFALECHQAAISSQKSLGLFHISLANYYNNTAVVHNLFSNHTEALNYHYRALEIRTKHLPPTHDELAESYSNLGQVYSDLGQYKLANFYLNKACAIQQKLSLKFRPKSDSVKRN